MATGLVLPTYFFCQWGLLATEICIDCGIDWEASGWRVFWDGGGWRFFVCIYIVLSSRLIPRNSFPFDLFFFPLSLSPLAQIPRRVFSLEFSGFLMHDCVSDVIHRYIPWTCGNLTKGGGGGGDTRVAISPSYLIYLGDICTVTVEVMENRCACFFFPDVI